MISLVDVTYLAISPSQIQLEQAWVLANLDMARSLPHWLSASVRATSKGRLCAEDPLQPTARLVCHFFVNNQPSPRKQPACLSPKRLQLRHVLSVRVGELPDDVFLFVAAPLEKWILGNP